jgi:aminoglycoside phosphotransferase (APT) family kinase protein
VMQYLSPHDHALWKQRLHDGHADAGFARALGRTLVRIHAFAAAQPALARQFVTDAIFFDIRLEPYLLATAARHPDLAPTLRALVAQTQANKCSLVHGDVSPKNILVAPAGAGPSECRAILLDAECAWWGDPAFDLAFCLNHLLLKCLWTPAATPGFLACFDALSQAYLAGVDWEDPASLEARAAALLAGLLLARVDGKSPVEYLETEAQRDVVRRCARALLLAQGPASDRASSPPSSLRRLADVRAAWQRELNR